MNWDALGAIAELIGSIAVVITLIYLAVQLRYNSKSTRLAAAHGLASTYTDTLSQISANPELTELYFKGLLGDPRLTKTQRRQFDLLILQFVRNGDVHFHSFIEGTMSVELWEATEKGFVHLYSQPGGKASWERQRHLVSESFRNHVEEKYQNA